MNDTVGNYANFLKRQKEVFYRSEIRIMVIQERLKEFTTLRRLIN